MTFDRPANRVDFVTLLLFFGFLQGCAILGGGVEAETSDEFEQLAGFMAGAFSSERQAGRDSSFYDVRLKMAPIWTDRGDGHWFYVEQAMFAHLARPYRQRVYHLTESGPGMFRSDVYTMDDPYRFRGAWSRRQPLAQLTPDSLELRDGCAIHLRMIAPSVYRGVTKGKSCESSLRGASYVTSEVVIAEHLVASWDRGFDHEGRQVWGAVSGPYLFDRLVNWSDRLEFVERFHGRQNDPGWGRPARGRGR